MKYLDMNYKEYFKGFRSNVLGVDPRIMNLYYKYFYRPKPLSIEAKIEELSRCKKPFYFLQIGGNDGFINDPIFKCVKRYSLKGIIVEPQKEVYETRLRKTYRNEKKVILENLAIADKNGYKRLYKIGISNSRWATGLASFNKETLEYQIRRNYVFDCAKKEGIEPPANIEDCITHEQVECITIKDLLQKQNFKTIDLLQIDTEGYDFEIIKTVDFVNLKPRLIIFENEHLSKEDLEDCEKLLIGNGYKLKHQGRDSIAYI